MKTIKQTKEELKQLAIDIRRLKSEFKNRQQYNSGRIDTCITPKQLWVISPELEAKRFEFRHQLIAYCVVRNVPREKIENYCVNLPNETYINQLVESYEPKNVCSDEK
jgi:hypothetical protein